MPDSFGREKECSRFCTILSVDLIIFCFGPGYSPFHYFDITEIQSSIEITGSWKGDKRVQSIIRKPPTHCMQMGTCAKLEGDQANWPCSWQHTPESKVDPRRGRPRTLGHRVLPVPLGVAPHHEQRAMLQQERMLLRGADLEPLPGRFPRPSSSW